MPPDIWTLSQCGLVTWVVWESVRPLVARWLRAETHLPIVAALGYLSLIAPAAIRACLTIAALVAVIRLITARRETTTITRLPTRR